MEFLQEVSLFYEENKKLFLTAHQNFKNLQSNAHVYYQEIFDKPFINIFFNLLEEYSIDGDKNSEDFKKLVSFVIDLRNAINNYIVGLWRENCLSFYIYNNFLQKYILLMKFSYRLGFYNNVPWQFLPIKELFYIGNLVWLSDITKNLKNYKKDMYYEYCHLLKDFLLHITNILRDNFSCQFIVNELYSNFVSALYAFLGKVDISYKTRNKSALVYLANVRKFFNILKEKVDYNKSFNDYLSDILVKESEILINLSVASSKNVFTKNIMREKSIRKLRKSLLLNKNNAYAKELYRYLNDSLHTSLVFARMQHDTRSKIGALKLSTEALKLKISMGNLREDVILSYVKQVETVTRSLNAIFDISMQRECVPKPHELYPFLEKIVLEHKNLEITLECDYNAKARFYEDYLEVILNNLLKNSYEAYLRQKIEKCLINMRFDSLMQVLYVTDYAGGIEPELVRGNKLFWCYTSTKKGVAMNIGLGLHLAKNAAQLMHAKLRLYATSKDTKSTTFCIEFYKDS